MGPHADHAESIGLIDGATVAMEALAVVAAGVLLYLPAERTARLPATASWSPVSPALALFTSVVLASPSARDHAAGAHGDHDAHDETAAADGSVADDGHDHDEAGADAPQTAVLSESETSDDHSDGHDHDDTTTVSDDLGFSLLMNGHQHEHEDEPMDPETTITLARQLAATAELVALHPTIAEAEAAGYRRQGPFGPGLGTHYGKGGGTLVGGVIDEQSVMKPMLIYDGVEQDSPLIGFMYMAYGTDGIPEGFAGPNDIWHNHTNVCVVFRPDGSTDASSAPMPMMSIRSCARRTEGRSSKTPATCSTSGRCRGTRTRSGSSTRPIRASRARTGPSTRRNARTWARPCRPASTPPDPPRASFEQPIKKPLDRRGPCT
ncbi:MAG: hypothetical protein R2695_18985 [Acidimicrobiales bacterium]